MPVFILGTGRSGTNVVLEILSGSTHFDSPGNGVEYQFFFPKKYPENCLLKADIVNFTEQTIKRNLYLNSSMKIIWTIRDPRDICMSKIRRGVPMKLGGDCKKFSGDATPFGAIENLRLMVNLYKKFKDHQIKLPDNFFDLT